MSINALHIHLFQVFGVDFFFLKASLASSFLLLWTRPPTWLPGEAALGVDLLFLCRERAGKWGLQAFKSEQRAVGLGRVWLSLGREEEEQQLMSHGKPAAVEQPHMWLPSAPERSKPQKSLFGDCCYPCQGAP